MSGDLSSKKKVRQRTVRELARVYASHRAPRMAGKTWDERERGTYWWGLYEGYQAGVKYGRRVK